jgi:hypothetical protein
MRNSAVRFCGSAAQATPRTADAKTKEFTVTVDLIRMWDADINAW